MCLPTTTSARQHGSPCFHPDDTLVSLWYLKSWPLHSQWISGNLQETARVDVQREEGGREGRKLAGKK